MLALVLECWTDICLFGVAATKVSLYCFNSAKCMGGNNTECEVNMTLYCSTCVSTCTGTVSVFEHHITSKFYSYLICIVFFSVAYTTKYIIDTHKVADYCVNC